MYYPAMLHAVRTFAICLGRSLTWLIDTVLLQVFLARTIHPPVGHGNTLPTDPGRYDASSYPAERRARAAEHQRLQRQQRSLRAIWQTPTNPPDGDTNPST